MDITNMIPAGDDNIDTAEDSGVAADRLHASEFDKFISAFEDEESTELAKSRIAEAEALEKDEAAESSEVDTGKESKETEGNTEVVKPDDSKKVEGEERAFERVAAKEKEVRDLNAKFEVERNKFLDEKRLFEQERQSLINPTVLTEALMLDTHGTLAKLGVDSERVMKSLLYSKLPDNHPSKAKLREELRDLDTKREMRVLREQIESRDKQAAQRAEYERTVTELGKYVEKLGEGSAELPTVSKVAKENRDYVNKRVLREIVEDARERYLRGETGDPLSYDAAAKRVEEDLTVLASVFGKVKPAENTNGKAEEKNDNVPSVTRPKLPAPAVKVKKEVTIEDLEQRAIVNAVAEYEKHEARRKSGYSGK